MKARRSLVGTLVLVALACGQAGPALAGGLYVYEIGAPDQMFAAAGREAIGRDASTAYTNPAAMTRLKQSEVLLGVQPIYADIRFDPDSATTQTGGDGGNAAGFVPSLGSFYVHSFTDRIKGGIAFNTYVGGGLHYDDDWAGRYFAQESSILTLAGTVSGAYKVNDWLSLGVGFVSLYTKLKMSAAIANLDAIGDARVTVEDDNVGFGGSASVLLEPTQTTRIGLVYQSKIKVDMGDAADLENVGPLLGGVLQASGLVGTQVNLDLTFPQMLHAGFYQELGDKLSLMVGIGWEDWSQFSDLGVTLANTTDTSFDVDLHVHDTWHGALGFEYRPIDRWRVGTGVAYDSGAINDKDRLPVLPLSRQWRWGAGFEHDLTDTWTLGFQYTLVDMGNAPINQTKPLPGTLAGEYATNMVHVFNFSVRKKF
jgi:long-chain fatty acid transport protein